MHTYTRTHVLHSQRDGQYFAVCIDTFPVQFIAGPCHTLPSIPSPDPVTPCLSRLGLRTRTHHARLDRRPPGLARSPYPRLICHHPRIDYHHSRLIYHHSRLIFRHSRLVYPHLSVAAVLCVGGHSARCIQRFHRTGRETWEGWGSGLEILILPKQV